jgi:hypothetical protein
MSKIVTYEHHGAVVFVREDLKGTHREHCLCFECGKFAPNTDHNCSHARELYAFCIRHDMVTPVFECPHFIKPVAVPVVTA